MKLLLLFASILVISCTSKKQENNDLGTAIVIPKVDVSSDTINNGGILACKAYLTFEPRLTPIEAQELITGFEVSFNSNGMFDPNKDPELTPAEVRNDTSYFNFQIRAPDTLTLAFVEHAWFASVKVHYLTKSERTIDTVFVESFSTIVRK